MKVFMIPKNHEYIRKLKKYFEDVGINVVILKPFHYSTFSNIAKLIFFRTKGFNIIHVHWLYIFPFNFVMKWFYFFCKLLNIKIIWEMHNIVAHSNKPRDYKASKWFYEHVDGIIFHSNYDIKRAKELLNVNKNKPHIVIPHGNFNDSYPNNISKEKARQLLKIPNDKKVILCFGFIRKNRGYEYLLEATRDIQDIEVIIAGKVQDKDVYNLLKKEERKRNNLHIYGKWIADDEIQIYFNACDIVVIPYTNITTSGIIPLAYAFKRPVITTEIGSLKEVVLQGVTGLLIPPKDVTALKNAIKNIFNMNLIEMGNKAFEYAERELSWENNALKIKKLYNEVMFNT